MKLKHRLIIAATTAAIVAMVMHESKAETIQSAAFTAVVVCDASIYVDSQPKAAKVAPAGYTVDITPNSVTFSPVARRDYRDDISVTDWDTSRPGVLEEGTRTVVTMLTGSKQIAVSFTDEADNTVVFFDKCQIKGVK